MKGKVSLALLVGLVLAACAPAFGGIEYRSIQHNLINGTGDTHYRVSDGRLWVSATNANNLSLNEDDGKLPGAVTNCTVNIESWFQSYDPLTNEAVFTGGTYDLDFNYNGSPYELSGDIAYWVLKYTIQSPTYSKIDGEGIWDAIVKDLPSSNNWPDGGGWSSITSLSLVFGLSIQGFAWTQNLDAPLRVETMYTLWPDDRGIPEPSCLILLAVGSLGLLRRRRA